MTEFYIEILKFFVGIIIIFFVLVILPICVKYRKSTYFNDTKKSIIKLAFDVGAYGEYRIYKHLKHYEKQGWKFLFNVYLPRGEETTEADVLLISPQGIFVFESKNYSGWIFGNDKYKMWTQTLPQGKGRKAKKEKFLNPIMQNNLHIKCLKEYLKEDIPMYSIIVFSERCELKKIEVSDTQVKVIKRNIVNRIIKSYSSMPCQLSEEKINEIYNKLYPLTQVSEDLKEKHVQDIKNRINN